MNAATREKFERALLVKMATDAKNIIRKEAAQNSDDGGPWLPGYADYASAHMNRINELLEEDLQEIDRETKK